MAPRTHPPTPSSGPTGDVPADTPTGEQWEIAHGRQRVVVTQVGATLRRYSMDGHEVLDGFGGEEWSHGGRGQILAPWPNRLGDGRYRFEGEDIQVPLNEPERSNAIHGIVRWMTWQLDVKAQNLLALRCEVFPTPAYPFHLEVRVEYRLGRDGLAVNTEATNVGQRTLPFGLGFHPYLRPSGPRIDTASLRLPAHERLVLDQRGLPTGEVRSVEGTEFDFTKARPVGSTELDTAYTGLERERDGRAWAELADPASGATTRLWMDEGFGYLMCFTGETLPDPERRRAIALEPMTCPPDAFRSGRGLIILESGQRWEGAWGIAPA